MNIPLPIISAIETALNAWLKLDGESLQKCEALEGKIIRLHITGLDLNLFFFPSVSGIQVMANYPDVALTNEDGLTNTYDLTNDDSKNNNSDQAEPTSKAYGKVDSTIHGSPMALMRLSTADNAGASMLKSDIEIDGDMHVAEKFSAILKEVDIDWEELLSRLVGDIIAHQASQVIRTGSEWFTESVDAMKLNTSEYLSEESKVTPAEAEISYYMDQVDDLRMNADLLQARVNNLNSLSDIESEPKPINTQDKK